MSAPPLGELSGMTWDPVRRKYFTTPKEVPVPAPIRPGKGIPRPPIRTERDLPEASGSGYKSTDSIKRRRLGGRETIVYRRKALGGYGAQDRGSLSTEDHFSDLAYEGTDTGCGCRNDRVLTLQTFGGGAYLAATDTGKVMMQDTDGTTHQLTICSEPLVGLHFDLARMTIFVIATGNQESPHVHSFRRDENHIDQLSARTFDIPGLSQKEIQCVASYDDVCVLGTPKRLTRLMNYEEPRTETRKLPSDPLCLEFGNNPYLVYSGMRNSSVLLSDLRTPDISSSPICSVPGGKAVVGVKRLDDAAVPYGLVASAMGNELLIYDTRFGRSPLHTLPDHINTYHGNLGLATTPDSRFLFASGSDRRIGLWSTITGERIHPSSSEVSGSGNTSSNPLRRTFPSMVQRIAVREDYGLSLGCGGEIIHYGKPGGHRWSEDDVSDTGATEGGTMYEVEDGSMM